VSVLQFVFSSFWTFLGTLILICAIGEAAGSIVSAFRGGRRE
jgi:hypothetical protein